MQAVSNAKVRSSKQFLMCLLLHLRDIQQKTALSLFHLTPCMLNQLGNLQNIIPKYWKSRDFFPDAVIN